MYERRRSLQRASRIRGQQTVSVSGLYHDASRIALCQVVHIVWSGQNDTHGSMQRQGRMIRRALSKSCSASLARNLGSLIVVGAIIDQVTVRHILCLAVPGVT